MPSPVFSPSATAATPATMAPPWMRQDGLRTVREHAAPSSTACDRRRHGVDAADQDVGAALGLHDVVGGERHVVIVEEGARRSSGCLVSSVSQMRADLGHVPVGGLVVEHLACRGTVRDHRLEALGAALCAGVAERALGHDDLALAAHRLVTSALVTEAPMNSLSGREEGVDVDRVERRDQRVHVDDRGAGVDHLLDRRR